MSLARGRGRRRSTFGDVEEFGADVLDEPHEHGVEVGKVTVEGRAGQPSGRHDVVDRQVAVGPLAQQRFGGVEDGLLVRSPMGTDSFPVPGDDHLTIIACHVECDALSHSTVARGAWTLMSTTLNDLDTAGRPAPTVSTLDASAAALGVTATSTTVFDWDYTGGRDQLLRLYDKGTRRQWVASDRIDWSTDLDPTNPLGVPDESIMLFGSPIWDRMSDREKGEVRRHQLAWQFSQFLHGEQGALMCTAKIVTTVPADRLEVLRGDAGDRRGPPRRGVQPLPARQARADLSDQPAPAPVARRRLCPTAAGTSPT